MKTTLKVFVFAALTLITLALTFVPIYKVQYDECIQVRGKVASIYVNNGSKDIQIRIENNKGRYYINNGIEAGLNIEELSHLLLNQEVNLLYVDHWSLLNFNGLQRHVSFLSYNGEEFFNEIEDFGHSYTWDNRVEIKTSQF